ncbi:TRAPP II complex [Gaertneriomyces semiglobifer]|nr:TRAPP II complex [Gaertneriomyces semiglobifer]
MYHHDGVMHLNFTTAYNKEHAPLEELDLSKQVVAVIGIMHCQQVQSIGEGFRKFQVALQRYPSVLASRCFAFEPSEQQADDTRGCIMIPNDPKKLDFYLMTQLNDLANELLVAFSNTAAHLEKRPMINSPYIALHHPSLLGGGFAQPGSTVSLNSPLAQGPVLSSSPGTLQPILSSGSMSSVSNMAVSATMSPSMRLPPTPSLDRGSSLSPMLTSQESNASMLGLGNLFAPDKTKKRTPARAQKLIGDLFLMAGRIDLAITNYSAAIDSMKTSTDHLWQAAALESYLCASLLSILMKAGIWPKLDTILEAAGSAVEPTRDRVTHSRQQQLTYQALFNEAQQNVSLRALLLDIPTHFREIVSLYERHFQANQPGYYPFLLIQSCIDIASYLSAMLANSFLYVIPGGAGIPSSSVESKGLSELASSLSLQTQRQGTTSSLPLPSTASVSPADKPLPGSPVSRTEISAWLMKAWASGIEFVSFVDQVHCVAGIARLYSHIGMTRKHAFFLRQTVLLLFDLLKSRKVLAGDGRGAPETTGIMDCLRIVCEGYGVGNACDRNSGEIDIDCDTGLTTDDSGWKRSLAKHKGHQAGCGWPDLQTDVLRECIEISTVCGMRKHAIIYALRLLNRMFPYLPAPEQAILCGVIESSTEDLRAGTDIAACGALEMTQWTALPQQESLKPRPLNKASDATKDPFVYNPYAAKQALKQRATNAKGRGRGDLGDGDILFIADEESWIECLVTNQLAIPIWAKDVVLRVDGVNAKTYPQEIYFPPQSQTLVRLSLTPLEPGSLRILGCEGHWNGITLRCPYRHGVAPARVTRSLRILPSLPLLLSASSSGSPIEIGMWEGEKAAHKLALRNVSKHDVRYLRVEFAESYEDHESEIDGEEDPEVIYERDVWAKSLKAFHWVADVADGAVVIKSGERKEIEIGLYGKWGCVGGHVIITYAAEAPSVGSGPQHETVYARSVSFPVHLTVWQGLRAENVGIVWLGRTKIQPDPSCFREEQLLDRGVSVEEMRIGHDTVTGDEEGNYALTGGDTDWCLLTFDLINYGNRVFEVEFEVSESGESSIKKDKAIMHHGETKRVNLSIPFLALPSPAPPIPEPSWRQYVVGSVRRIPKEEETVRRLMFWFWERVCSEHVKCSWRGGGRQGDVSLRGGGVRNVRGIRGVVGRGAKTIITAWLEEFETQVSADIPVDGKPVEPSSQKPNVRLYAPQTLHVQIVNHLPTTLQATLDILSTPGDTILFSGRPSCPLPPMAPNEARHLKFSVVGVGRGVSTVFLGAKTDKGEWVGFGRMSISVV